MFQLSTTFRLQAKNMNGTNNYTTTYVWLGDPVTVIGEFVTMNEHCSNLVN